MLPACDRFRIVLPLSEKIVNDRDYKATWFELSKLFPKTDPTSKDSSHFYYPCKDVIGIYKGEKITVKKAFDTNEKIHANDDKNYYGKGNLANRTYKFILNGAPDGKFHNELIKALIDLKEQQYTKGEAISFLQKGVITLNKEDMRQVNDIYDQRPVKYTPRKGFSNFHITYQRKSIADRERQVLEDRVLREKALASAVPFLCAPFDGVCKLTMGLTLMGSETGKGKSTVVANIIYYFLKHSDKNVMVVSNEESSEDLLSRVSCLIKNVSWKAYRFNEIGKDERQEIEKEIKILINRVEINPPYDPKTNTSKLEDVIGVFECIKGYDSEFGLIIMDYLQNVSESEDTNVESYKVSKELGKYLKEYGARVPIPVVVMCQLRPNSKNEYFNTRIQNDRTIANHASLGIEIEPDFETKITNFYVRKDRWFDNTGQKVVTEFKKGKFINPKDYIKTWGVQSNRN